MRGVQCMVQNSKNRLNIFRYIHLTLCMINIFFFSLWTWKIMRKVVKCQTHRVEKCDKIVCVSLSCHAKNKTQKVHNVFDSLIL